jgi:hypothetical protein
MRGLTRFQGGGRLINSTGFGSDILRDDAGWGSQAMTA